MKRLCIVCDGYWDQLQGGAEYQLYLLANEMYQRGWEVHYVYVDRGSPIAPTEVNLHPLRLPDFIKRVFFPYHFLFARQLRNTLDAISPDIIINRVANAFVGICAAYATKHNIPNCWQIANETDLMDWRNPGNRTMLASYLDKKMFDSGVHNSTFISAQAEYQIERLQAHFGRSADLLLKNFHPLPGSDEAGLHSAHAENIKTVVWVANIKAKKQPDVFINLARAFADRDDVRFVMVGRLEHERERAQFERDVEATANLEYAGELPIDQVNTLLAGADVFVNTSYYEGFPNTFIQAWMRKVPVVSLLLDPDDVLKQEAVGFHSGTFEQLVEDVRTLVDDDQARCQIGQRAYTYAARQHELIRNVDIFEAFALSVI